MSEDQPNTASAADTAASTATGAAMDAYLSGNKDKAAGLFQKSTAAHERATPSETGTDPAWRDDSNDVPLPPMPDNPEVSGESDAAVTRMAEMGGAHADLINSWGGEAAVNVQYARSAFAEAVAADPGLVAAFDRSGLGSNATVIEWLAKHGRLSAGLMNDNTIARNNVTNSPIASRPRGGSSAQNELNELLDANPPGTAAYKSPKVQQRVEALSRLIAGSGVAIGQGGRTA
jgi:hypothetical protein